MANLLYTNSSGAGPTIVSKTAKADGFYGLQDGIHTVGIYVNGFVGVITVQATLSDDPTDDDWFDLPTTVLGDGSTVISENTFRVFTGNFSFVRVNVTDFTAGVINRVSYSN